MEKTIISPIIEKNRDKKIALVTLHLYLILCKNILAATISYVQSINGLLNNYIIIIIAISYAWVFFISERKIKVPQATIKIIFLLIIYFILSWLFKPDLFVNEGVREQLKTFFAYCFPLFFAISAINDYDALFMNLAKYAFIPFLFSVIGFVYSFQFLTSSISYSMSYGYSVLFINSIYLFKYKMFRNKSSLIIFILTTVFILVSGSRGPIVYIAMAVVVVYLTSNLNSQKMLLSAVAIAIILLVAFNYKAILEWSNSFLRQFGIYSRTLSMLQLSNITSDSGREAIHESLITQINTSPIWGLGAFGGAYYVYLSHSLFLDIFACFGYVGGSAILILIVYKTYIVLRQNWDTPTAEFVLMLTVLTFAGSLFSDSFFEKKELWMLFGIFAGNRTHISRDTKRN